MKRYSSSFDSIIVIALAAGVIITAISGLNDFLNLWDSIYSWIKSGTPLPPDFVTNRLILLLVLLVAIITVVVVRRLLNSNVDGSRNRSADPSTQKRDFRNGATEAPNVPDVASSPTTLPSRELVSPVHFVKALEHLVTSSQYERAVAKGREALEAIDQFGYQNNPEYVLTKGMITVWYAHALMYVGRPKEAIALLQATIERTHGIEDAGDAVFGNWRFHFVLGRAHNHIGYAYWMEFGYYELALEEFFQAVPHFVKGDLKKELATVYDNIGRVYAQLGYRTRAEVLIGHGRRLREQMNDDYRYALSLNSQAVENIAFGQSYSAYNLSQEALHLFHNQEDENGRRGKGLSLITMGQAQRFLGTEWKDGKRFALERSRQHLQGSIITLRSAVDVFETVREPIRLFQAYNELGCVYRELMQLDGGGDPESGREAIRYLKKSSEMVQGVNAILYADACEDLAQAYYFDPDRRNAVKNAMEWLGHGERALNDAMKSTSIINGSGAFTPTNGTPLEEAWQQLGKINLLKGHIVLDSVLSDGRTGRAVSATIEQAFEYYSLAAGYFGRFLDRPLVDSERRQRLYPSSRPQLAHHRRFIHQVYEKMQRLQVVDWRDIQNKLSGTRPPQGINQSWLTEFYEDTLYLSLDMTGESPWGF